MNSKLLRLQQMHDIVSFVYFHFIFPPEKLHLSNQFTKSSSCLQVHLKDPEYRLAQDLCGNFIMLWPIFEGLSNWTKHKAIHTKAVLVVHTSFKRTTKMKEKVGKKGFVCVWVSRCFVYYARDRTYINITFTNWTGDCVTEHFKFIGKASSSCEINRKK